MSDLEVTATEQFWKFFMIVLSLTILGLATIGHLSCRVVNDAESVRADEIINAELRRRDKE